MDSEEGLGEEAASGKEKKRGGEREIEGGGEAGCVGGAWELVRGCGDMGVVCLSLVWGMDYRGYDLQARRLDKATESTAEDLRHPYRPSVILIATVLISVSSTVLRV